MSYGLWFYCYDKNPISAILNITLISLYDTVNTQNLKNAFPLMNLFKSYWSLCKDYLVTEKKVWLWK